MNHPKKVEKYNGNQEELAEDIANLDYDSLVELFDLLSKKFDRDSDHDMDLGHPQVSEKLKNISIRLKEILEEEIRPLANVCREYNRKGIK